MLEDFRNSKLSGSLETNADINMYFRKIRSEFISEVTFKNLYSSTRIHLLNFQDIDNIIVQDSSFQSVDNLDVKHTSNCYTATSDQELTRVNCTKLDLFYSASPSRLTSEPLTQNPAFIVPIVILSAMVLIIVAVVFFIKIKKYVVIVLLRREEYQICV